MKNKTINKNVREISELISKKSVNEKEVNILSKELEQFITIIKPTRNSKIYEKFE